MSNLNQCNFIGRVGQDVEQRFMPSGKGVVNLSIGVSEKWKDQQGQQQESTEWVRVVAFDKLSDIIAQYVNKGDLLYISGKMKTKKYQDQQGNDKFSTEIIANQIQMLSSKQSSQNNGQQAPQNNQQRPQSNGGYNQQQPNPRQAQQKQNVPDFEFDDSIPF